MTENTATGSYESLNVPPVETGNATEIMPGVFLGGMTDARSFVGVRLCVRDEGPDYLIDEFCKTIALLIPCPPGFPQPYCFSKDKLEEAANFIKVQRREGKQILVHCMFGRDRSPMVVAWWMCKMGHALDLSEAYAFIQAKRPVVVDRQAWLEPILVPQEGSAPIVTQQKGEQAKYVEMWSHEEYRQVAPGETCAAQFLEIARPKQGAAVLDFGAGTGRGAIMLAMLGGLQVKMLDFAPNCLDDFVRQALDTQPLLSFAECNLVKPIKHTAEYGYCTDVMEHIPPDWVTTVLINILNAAQHVFFQISCEPDSCGKLIGEELHLSVHPYSWWMERLQKIGVVVHWSQDFGTHCMIYCSAWAQGKDIVDNGVLNVTVEQVRKNVEANLKGPWIDIGPHSTNDVEVAILGGGPSLEGFVDELHDFKAAGGKVVTLNGAYNWARERGLWPVNQFVVDARPHNARFTKPVDARNTYFIASQCDPAVLEGLPQERTYLWHTAVESIRDLLDAERDLWIGTPGGSTVLLRAIPLLRMMGFRKFHLYGCDSCLRDTMNADNVHHAYEQKENDGVPVIPVIVQGRTFMCHPWMVSQAQEFMDLIKVFGNEIEICVRGDGLLAWILESGAKLHDEELSKFIS